MSTPPARTSGWTQPDLLGTDQNLNPVHRKFAGTHDPVSSPAFTTPDRPPVSASAALPAEEAEEHRAVAPVAPSDADLSEADAVEAAVADAVTVDPDAIDQANERRIAKQWEDVIARLCREFAPDGGADRKLVLAQIAQQRAQLDSAAVRDYLPVLVDRAVRRIYASDEPVRRGPGSSAR